MRSEIKSIINQVYCKNDNDLFIRGCNNRLGFIDDLITKIKMSADNVELYDSENEPTEEIHIAVNVADAKGITIRYDSILYINKIVKYYYLQHEFSMDNPDSNAIDPCLDGFRDEAYSKKQFIMDEMIVDYLSGKGYTRLSYNEMEEVFHEPISISDTETDKYITVNNALFMDYFGLCESLS